LHLTEYAQIRNRRELLSQWDTGRNPHLSLEHARAGSDVKVWWKCERSHSWEATISSRAILGRGCPYCTGQRVAPGENDLAHRYPKLVTFWDREKNTPALPERVMPGTHLKYWWRCERGHCWQAPPSTLIQGSGCPYCAGKKALVGETDLETLRPDLAKQWHPEKNGELTPQDVMPGSTKKVWWRCENNHDYQAVIFSRSDGTGCPYCAGRRVWPGFNDLATLFPHLAREWDAELNGSLTPQSVTKGSHKSVWWRCESGHAWKSMVFSRTREKTAGCPVCAGKIKLKKNA